MDENEIIDAILTKRNIHDKKHFLNPIENDLLPLDNLKNINVARDIVLDGIKNQYNFIVHYDVDSDGISAGTIMEKYLNNFTKNVKGYINNGKMHGLLNQDLQKYKETDILIVVDSLDKNILAYKEIAESGVQIIVLDHHKVNFKVNYNKYVTLVSSQQEYKNPALSGAGVVWKFCKYIDKYFDTNYSDSLIDLAACGLVGDMSDMSEQSMENRYIVHMGLNNLQNLAIKKIIGSFPFNSTSISYSICPLINAANRTNNNEIARKTFLAEDNKEVLNYLKQLKKCKKAQNEEIDRLLDGIIIQADKQINNKIIYVFTDTKLNINGLIGNKLLEKYQRPLLILKKDIRNNEIYFKGSARAIGVNDFITMCKQTNLCEANGHELAFGIEIKESDFNDFINNLESQLKNIEFKNEKIIDIEIDLSDLTRSLVNKVKVLDRISGEGFKPILVKIAEINDYEVSDMSGGKHLVLNPNDFTQLIKWNFSGDWNEIEDASLLNQSITVVGNLDSGWLGRKFSLKLIINDMKVGD